MCSKLKNIVIVTDFSLAGKPQKIPSLSHFIDFSAIMDDIKKRTPDPPPRPFMLDPSVSTHPTQPPVYRPKKKKFPLWRGLFIVFSLGLFLLLVLTGVLLFKSISLGERMQFDRSSSRSFVTELRHLKSTFLNKKSTSLQGEETGRINILLLGRAGERYPGKNLTDTVMIMSIAPATNQVALLSLPRDLYVPIAGTDFFTKLNSLYQYGLSNNDPATLKQTLEEVTHLPIHYFVTLDFDGFEKIVDTLGGISLEVPRDFSDTRYPGKNYSYETFEIKKGWQTLDGATALKYVRERHADPEGDFGRAKRQQQVIQAIKNKIFSLGTLWNIVTIDRLLETLGDSVKTDMSFDDMTRFLELSRTLDTKNVTTVVIDAWKKESLLRVSHIQVGDIAAFILVPRVGNWSEIQDVSTHIFSRDEREKRKNAIVMEQSTVTIYYKATDREATEKIADLLRTELGFSRVTTLILPPFHTRPKESIIVGRVGLQKPFSLDELLKRFALTEASSLPFSSRQSEESDFSIILGDDLTETFSLEETSLDLTAEDPSFSEPLPPQPRSKKK